MTLAELHQISRFHVFEACLREAMAFCAVIRSRTGISVLALNLGGGHAEGDDGFALAAFASRVHAMMYLSAERYGIAEPRLTVSPGRAVVARAGLTLHRVTAVSRSADEGRLVVALDGGVPDCAVAADCAGHHTVALVGRVSLARMQPASVVGGPEDASRTSYNVRTDLTGR